MATEISRKIATLPPEATALTKHTMDGKPLPPAHYIVSEAHPEGVYLFRYSENWKFSGDTWHQTLEDLLAQVDYEFGAHEIEWKPISQDELIALTR